MTFLPFRLSHALPRRAALLALVLGLSAAACGQASQSADSVSLDTARADLQAGRAVLIDIREPNGARLLPMRQLGARLSEIPTDPNQPVLLICNTQNRSSSTLQSLRQRGYANVRYVQGGMSEWTRRGWPLVKPGT
jgi:rhodanese-related sulfurtransferase